MECGVNARLTARPAHSEPLAWPWSESRCRPGVACSRPLRHSSTLHKLRRLLVCLIWIEREGVVSDEGVLTLNDFLNTSKLVKNL